MLPWKRRPKRTQDLAEPSVRFSADLNSFSTSMMNAAETMSRFYAGYTASTNRALDMLRNPSQYDSMTAEQIRALLTPKAWDEIKAQAEAELAEGRVQDKTDQPVKITIEPAKLRPKRRIE